jgi:hypothetical protein
MPVSVSKSGPGVASLAKRLKQIQQSDVLVGIPAERTVRKDEPVNNASLLYLHTHGSPLKNIPARPVIEPAIQENRAIIAPHLGAAGKQVLNAHPDAAARELKLAGTIAANAAKRYVLTEHHLAPNAPSTIKAKGSDRPLVDTTQMVRAITYAIRQNGVEVHRPEPQHAPKVEKKQVGQAAETALVEDIAEV